MNKFDQIDELRKKAAARRKAAQFAMDAARVCGSVSFLITLGAAAVGLTAYYTRDPMLIFIAFAAWIGFVGVMFLLASCYGLVEGLGYRWEARAAEKKADRLEAEPLKAPAVPQPRTSARSHVPAVPQPRASDQSYVPARPRVPAPAPFIPPEIDDSEIRAYLDIEEEPDRPDPLATEPDFYHDDPFDDEPDFDDELTVKEK